MYVLLTRGKLHNYVKTYMHDYKKLTVWIKSRELVKNIFTFSNAFPQNEKFGFTSQLKRSVISIPSNIAEGYGRDSIKQLNYSLNVALGSATELET